MEIIYLGDDVLSIFKSKAIVIKAFDFKESDKLIWLFTEKLGKISVIVKGAKKSKSKLLSLTLPFCFGDYVLFRGKNLYTLNEGEIINSFQSLLNNLDSLTYASYLCELIDIAMVEEESNRELFKDLMSVFYLMENNAVDYDLLMRAFEVKLIMLSGYKLNLDSCVVCREKISKSDYINLEFLGGVCEKCNRHNGLYISYSTYNSLKFLTKASLQNIYKLTLTKENKAELYKLLSAIISDVFGKKPNSLETFKILKGVD